MNPPFNQAQTPCILLHCMYIYRREIDHPVNRAYLPCILL